MHGSGVAGFLAAMGALQGCIIETLHVPERTGGEQAVMARAIERACEKLPLESLGTSRVRIDVATLMPDVSKYVESVLRLRLLRQGASVADDPAGSPPERELHVLVSETGPETRTKIFQIPAPIPVATGTVPIGLTFWERQTEKSVVRLRAYVFDPAENRIVAELASSSAQATKTETTLFTIVGPFRKEDPDYGKSGHASPVED